MKSKIIVRRGNARLEVENTLTRFSNGRVRTGILNGGETHPSGNITFGELALIHEFGAPNASIPSRQFLWRGTQLAKPEMKKLLPRLGEKVRKGHITEQAALRQIGELLQKGMRRTFKEWEGHWAPLAPSTIQKKGHEQPLIETRALYDAIAFEVDKPKAGAR